MKKVLVVCLISLATSGCVTTRTCGRQKVEGLKAQSVSDSNYYYSQIFELNKAWMTQYCKMIVQEERRYAYVTHAKTISVPKACLANN